MMSNYKYKNQAFTLVELLVSIAIMSFVILVIHQLFNEVTTTVRRGKQTGEIIQRARAINDQIKLDSEFGAILGNSTISASPPNWATPFTPPYNVEVWESRMLGPWGDITTASTAANNGGFLIIINKQQNAPLTFADAEDGTTTPIRSDQLLFFASNKVADSKLPALAPANDNTYEGSMHNAESSDIVRIWYGHVPQTHEDGSFNPATDNLGTITSGNPNTVASEWIFGRQVLHLADPSKTPVGRRTRKTQILGGAVTNPGILATSPVLGDADVSGKLLHDGVIDVAEATMADVVGTSNSYIDSIVTGNMSSSPDDYADKLLQPGTSFMFNHERLITTTNPFETTLRTVDLAPSHNFFMGGVSDFVIEWAGDLYTAGTNPSTATAINSDGMIDRLDNGQVIWYSHIPNNPIQDAANYDPNQPLVYRPATEFGPGREYTPYYTGANLGPYADAAFVFANATSGYYENGTDKAHWPWMIRIRYRLHDRGGDYKGRTIYQQNGTPETDPEVGQWFETVFFVNRQPSS
ncbi:PulJ/GspJ family protein [Poriferisphaera sp. WC338]|uniref:PulJ/GspJ family protein n=1 Tax=Poriferisphaera sp. WC338 TaxID=3425129 RepID=UPI003D81B78D